jgi:putative membrane protein
MVMMLEGSIDECSFLRHHIVATKTTDEIGNGEITVIEVKDRPRTPSRYLRLFGTGVAMGSADVIPGVSGGTMAFILGIYEELLNAIKSFNLEVIKLVLQLRIKEALDRVPWRFLLALGAGILTAIFSLAQALSWTLEHQPVLLFAFFFGLILASILSIGAKLRWSLSTLVALGIGTVVAYMLVGLVPLDMPHDPLTLFLSGMVAIMAMILPGISGAFILLILGQYEFVLRAVTTFDIVTILSVALGAVVGLMGFARVLSWMLRHYEQVTVAVLVGFMAGSLRRIWPWKITLETMVDRHGDEIPIRVVNVLPDVTSGQFWVALALCVFGFVLISVLDHLQSRANPFVLLLGRSSRRSAVGRSIS